MEIQSLSHKTIQFRYRKHEINLALSHGLFSSNDVDTGTRLLLKCLGDGDLMAGRKSIIDIGSGTGVIGIALATAYPGVTVTAQDRDRLAVEFTGFNAKQNNVNIECRSGLLLNLTQDERYDLIVTNIPAKAGRPALRDFFVRSPDFLNPGGIVAVVIVDTLADQARATLEEEGLEILREETGREHVVFVFSRPKGIGDDLASKATRAPQEELSPYIRGRSIFNLGGDELELDTVYGVEDFDILGHRADLAQRFFESRFCAQMFTDSMRPRVFWSPGQGLSPIMIARKSHAKDMLIAGRDLLELEITQRNLVRLAPATSIKKAHLASPDLVFDELENWLSPVTVTQSTVTVTTGKLYTADLFLYPDSIPGVDWSSPFFERASECLSPGSRIVIVAESSSLSILDKRRPRGFTFGGERRDKGFRAVLFTKV